MKIAVLVLFILLSVTLIVCNIFLPRLKLKKIQLQTFWIVSLIFAIVTLCLGVISWNDISNSFFSDVAVNPLKIIVLFFSMTLISVFLDEIGFFSFIAYKCSLVFKKNQYTLFFGLYLIISILTVFTSNDIIILTFTPFICFLCKRSNLKPVVYLFMEFVAANTWSLCLIIGNPTNIYIASSFNIAFFDYFIKMIIPTLAASITSLLIMFVIFFKFLKEPISMTLDEVKKPNTLLLVVGLVHLISATILLAVSSYINWPMWIIAGCFALSLLIFVLIYSLVSKSNYVFPLMKRIPWSLLPFVLSMFIIVLALVNTGWSQDIINMLHGTNLTAYSYGLSGGVSANLINNIPMSVLYTTLLNSSEQSAMYASIAASNIAAYITPLGSLAGIMFVGLVNKHDIKFSFLDFTKYGLVIGLPTLVMCITVIQFLHF